MLSDREQFRYRFLLGCAARGIDARGAEKVAAAMLAEKRADGLLATALRLPMLGLGLAAAGGAGIGLTAAHLRKGTLDPDEVKKQELIAAYNTFAQQARLARPARGPAGGPR